ncbi:hypothetical protein HU200_029231 [Digitaria exilis]|uniref:No apical meristem-associated C-terminal domain-containing protein n=1 Tax=Digitaria exilis TaxID=1010633 RepID=A0A835BUD4_9POAL|nr:hypothetical protein HU200_029231 [Digitaria exilis]
MARSGPLGKGEPSWGSDGDGSSRNRLPGRLAGPPPPHANSGNGRPPRPSAGTSASKKRRSTFVAPTRPPAHRPGGVLPCLDLNAGVDLVGVRQQQAPDDALAPGAFLRRQLFEAPPPGSRLPSPLRHEPPRGSVFTDASKNYQTPSSSEPARLPSHQVQKTSMEAAATATASDTPRTTSTTSIQDEGDYFSSSPMPYYDWSSSPTADNTFQDPVITSQSYFELLTRDSADLEVITQTQVPDSGSSKGRGGNYNHNEDIQTFTSDRNATSLEKRWNGSQKECIRFQECIEKIERLHPSGVPHTEYINLAQKSYDKTKGFPYLHCWTEVRHTEKFQTVYEAMKQAQGKRQKPKETTPSQEAHEDDRVPSKRPPGQKQSKQKSKKHDGEDEYAVQFATFIEMKAEEHRKRDQRWKAEKDLEERKLLWEQEQKIMFCGTSVLDETQKAYVIAMRKHIASAKEASVNGESFHQ